MEIKNIKLSDFLELLRNYPSMYMSRPSLELMDAMLTGFQIAHHGDKEKIDIRLLDFRNWLATRYKIEGQVGWAAIIALYSNYEENGFKRFWELYDAWKSGKKAKR